MEPNGRPDPDFRTFFEKNPRMSLVMNTSFIILAVNDIHTQATHSKREEVVGKSIFEAFPDNPDDPEASGNSNLRASLERVLATKTTDTMPVQKYDVAKADGTFEERYWNIINSPILDENGEVLYIYNHADDCTDFMRMKKVSEQLNGEFQEKSEKMELELFLRNKELEKANQELLQSRNDLEKAYMELQTSEEELQAGNEELRSIQEELEQSNQELEARNEDLEKASMAILLKAEELERSSSFKSNFLSNMSHELRTPLNSMLILSSLLKENKNGTLTEKEVEFASVINKAGKDLLSLINDILDLSKIESGKMEMLMEPVFLHDLCNNLETIFQPIAQQKNIDFQVLVNAGTPEQIYTDGQRLEQVLKNLLSNAFKFTENEGSVLLEVSHQAAEHDQPGTVSFAVKDTGIGIEPEKQADIFKAFQQADNTTSRKYGGSGLGLSISRQLASLLGGEIELESEPGKGSTFTILLPFTPSIGGKAEKVDTRQKMPDMLIKTAPVSSDQEKELRKLLDGKLILIADDDERNLRSMKMVLEPYGAEIITAMNGKAALELLENDRQVDLVIMDIIMPDMNGYETMQHIRKHPRYAKVPMIALTAMASKVELQKCMKAGASDYLSKPLDLQYFFSLLKVWLGKSEF